MASVPYFLRSSSVFNADIYRPGCCDWLQRDADHVTADLSPTSHSPPRLGDTPEILLHGHTWRSSLTTFAEVSRPRW